MQKKGPLWPLRGVKMRIRMPSKWPIHPQIYHRKMLLCIHTPYH